ncbi:MAG: hypothetical protein M1825_004665 [Sarcosagium campestre]|nr:MAG: hypothetical protein M1825_004665 [Sarcosagium campestre]
MAEVSIAGSQIPSAAESGDFRIYHDPGVTEMPASKTYPEHAPEDSEADTGRPRYDGDDTMIAEHAYSSLPHRDQWREQSDEKSSSSTGRRDQGDYDRGKESSGPSEDEHNIFDDDDDDDVDCASSATTSHHSDEEYDDDDEPGPDEIEDDNNDDEDDTISQFPEDSVIGESSPPPPPFTLAKERRVFRNPSSVRAMQLETTPPPLLARSPTSTSSNRAAKRISMITTPRSGGRSTPRRSGGTESKPATPSRKQTLPRPPPPPPQRREHPLVLLHVTLLPVRMPCSLDAMEAALPPYLIENYNHLRDRVNDTVLARGILLPHPREDYELLEERLLESLDLRLPRILKCGHFHRPEDVDARLDAAAALLDHHEHGNQGTGHRGNDDDQDDDEDDGYDAATDGADVCEDCGRRVRTGVMGSAGTGSKRWNIKIFAANGLMRAGAWTAAWREMERVDVEIAPWIPEDLRRELDRRSFVEREEAAEAAAAAAAAETAGAATILDDRDEVRGELIDVDERERQRLREIYGEDGFGDTRSTPSSMRRRRGAGAGAGGSQGGVDALGASSGTRHRSRGRFVDGQMDADGAHEHIIDSIGQPPRWQGQHLHDNDNDQQHRNRNHSNNDYIRSIPLSVLARNYLYLVMSDPRNMAIGVLCLLVALMALRPGGGGSDPLSGTVSPISGAGPGSQSESGVKVIGPEINHHHPHHVPQVPVSVLSSTSSAASASSAVVVAVPSGAGRAVKAGSSLRDSTDGGAGNGLGGSESESESETLVADA